ncbi:MAG TPA: LamG-like jellyroll fold domain-containing protein [Verrucomicrobiae bacterium]|nr:LamG-like jellyroll fold domain-containing protein [Verrucomicrobiae bacterium]
MTVTPRASAATAMIFCNGNLGSASGLTTSQINGVRASGFTTMILFTMTVQANGDFTYNEGVLICSNGVYVGPSNWGALLNQCRVAPTTINRIEMSIAGWGDPSWTNIKNLIAANGTNSSTVLYRNLAALKAALGIDAICNDDESAYDSASTILFGKMCASVGLKSTLCPYTNPNYWQAVYNGLGVTNCDAVYLQCYDGGAGNNPATWNSYFPGLKVIPGYWDWERTPIFYTNMVNWSAAGGPGGFYWPSCTGCNPPADAAGMKQYATWIQDAFFRFQPEITPASGFNGIAAFNQLTLPTSTAFTLTNGTTNPFSWSLSNTSSWLTVSASSGSLAAGATSSVTVSLNTTIATNLAQGFYTANIVFTNPTVGGNTVRTFMLNTAVANWPLTISGFNAGIIASNNATAGAPGATGFDIPNNYCFFQQGLNGSARGLPGSGVFTSLVSTNTAFKLGPFAATNALMLGNTYPRSGTLTLNPPQALNSLAVLATSANGGGQGTFFLTFTNGTKSPVFAFNAQDWFFVVTNVAIQGFGRLKLGANLVIEDNGASNPNLYQTTVNLAALGLSMPVASITFSNRASAGANETTAILGLSGMPATAPLQPPANLTAIPGTNATVRLSWSPVTGATNYNIRQSFSSGSGYAMVASTNATSITISGLANGYTYYFVVSAQGTLNESADSIPVSAMPGSYLAWAFSLNPIAYWPLNELTGSTAYELVRGSNGVYNGGFTLTTGGANGAGFSNPHRIAFYNGTSGYTQVPRVIGGTSFSIVFWMRTATTGGTPNWYNGRGLVDGEVGGSTGDFGVALVGNKVGFGIGNPDTTLTSVKTVNDNQWHQVVATRDSGNGAMALYIDGQLDNSTTGPTGSRTSPPALRFGSLQTGVNYFAGSLSDVAMYPQVLTSNQIATLYNSASGTFYDVTLTNRVVGDNLVLNWIGNGKLLEATNLFGPWTTNASVSPVTIIPNQPQKFFRIQTQ